MSSANERRKVLERNRKERKALEHKWKSGEGSVRLLLQPDAPLLKELGLTGLGEIDDKLRCSFCGREIDEINATYGTISVGGTIRVAEVMVDPPDFREEVKVFNSKVVACPEHCLNIKPIYNRNGEKISSGIKLPMGD